MRSVSENKEEPVGDYYLFSFSDDELMDVLRKPDEWNEFDLYWAKKILHIRGVEIKPEDLEKAKQERLDELKQPWILDKLWIICAIALWILAFGSYIFMERLPLFLLALIFHSVRKQCRMASG
ncbi:MAG: hypothetical protein WDO71_22415 [Bacteroidota bacterium]